jgi:hypothetical protein
MGRFIVGIAVVVWCGAGASAAAADLSLRVTDTDNRPLANAVVALTPDLSPPPPAPSASERRTIDQQHETFVPLVTILRRGGQVVFRNSDPMHHHAYSFSPVKRFELVLDPGQESQPVEFDTPGVAAIGCNIHDQMIAYVYVADTPWTALTNAEGRARIVGIPPGGYRAAGWHPRLRPGAQEPVQHLAVTANTSDVDFVIPVLPERPSAARHEHDY